MKTKILPILTLLFLLLGASINVWADDDYYLSELCVNDVEDGPISSYGDFTILPPVGSSSGPDPYVESSGRTINGRSFTKSITTGGKGDIDRRAIKFTAPAESYVTFYVKDASNELNTEVIVNNGSSVIYSKNLESVDVLVKTLFLEDSGDYYIYGNSAIRVYFVCNHKITYDINYDMQVNHEDFRLFYRIKCNPENYTQDEFDSADFDDNGYIDDDDQVEIEDWCSYNDIAISRFYSNVIWNISSWTTGVYESYAGLEIIQPNVTTDKKIEIVEASGSYDDLTFTKCIKTNGDVNEDYKGYPVSKAIKMNVAAPGYLEIYMKSGSSSVVNPVAEILSGEGNVQSIPLTKNIEKYVIRVDEADTYYLYSTENSGSINIYYIKLFTTYHSDATVTKTISATADKEYTYYFTMNNSLDTDLYTYIIKYDSSILEVKSIGAITNGDNMANVEIISNMGGVLKFKVDKNSKHWSGIVTPVTFKALQTNQTEIAFTTE